MDRHMTAGSKQKNTPAIRRAMQSLQQSLTQLQQYDLCAMQQQVQCNALSTDQQHALADVLERLYQLAQAESLRDSGGKQADMFSGLDKADFSAWARPINQRTLF